jgi:signal transduction histidine kinase
MKQEHILSILYELAMVLSGEVRSRPLIENFLQRLMFHTGFPCGLFLSDITLDADETTAYLHSTIGDPVIAQQSGQRLTLPAALTQGKAELIDDPALLTETFGEAAGWRSLLKLPVGNDNVFLLLSPQAVHSDAPFTTMFDPVLRNFLQVLNLCYANEAYTAELEMANQELEAFSYSVSHDLRAPLRSIDGFSLAVLEDCGEQLSDDGKDFLQRIRNNAQRMDLIINDLIKLSRTTQATLTRKQVDMSELAKQVFADLCSNAPQRDIEIQIAEHLEVEADPALITVALDNLLGNAWKYTGKKTRAVIEFGVRKKGRDTVYFVKDNGAGFDMRQASKLFGVFQRLHGATEFSGTGIGLATVQRVIHRHGGKIWAEAELDKGATFFFTLPAVAKNVVRP